MPPTRTSSPQASPAVSSLPDPSAPGRLCAIHQPNLFPRLSTLAKLYAADCWIVLDDVQFARRDYQHRARLAALHNPRQRQWLTLPTHLPHGRGSLVSEARLVDSDVSSKRLALLLRQYYGSSRYWSSLDGMIQPLLELLDTSDRTAVVAEASARLLLDLLGRRGSVVRSSAYPAREGRSERLADLAKAVGADLYLCGTGGARYLRSDPFDEYCIGVALFRTPAYGGAWTGAREISALWALATYGPQHVADLLRDRTSVQASNRFELGAG
ncbi:WbqC family protein [Streptomyces sp. NRRL S-37]|uniref:WbqC family protein n=1 Tax=Streptomyces sp. NRRL S-37 TaxID=1463903 RepID=UPI00099D0BC5|nr:WbqC family protein [Streptomyces sp. NRRL S-37]